MPQRPSPSESDGAPGAASPAAVLLLGLLTLLGFAVPARAAPELTVAASTAVVADLLRQVAGGEAAVLALAPPGQHPRTAAPSPAMLAAAGRMGLYVRVGSGLEGGADRDLLERVPAGMPVLDLSLGADLIGESPPEEAERKILSAALGVDDTAPRASPFFLLDPMEAVRTVDLMAAALSDLRPEGAGGFRARAELLKGRIAGLDGEIRRRLPEGPAPHFVTFSGAWGYFARRYGLKAAPAAGLTPGGGPGRHSLAGTSARIVSLGAGAVFTDLTFPRRPAEEAAAAAGVPLVVLEPFGAPGRGGYLAMMRRNLELIAGGLSGR